MNIKTFKLAMLVLCGFLLMAVAYNAGQEQARLVGLGCGPQHKTLVVVEEDDLPPPCYVVDTPQNLCGTDDATECADYLGAGY